MKNRTLYFILFWVCNTNLTWAESGVSKINFYNISNSYVLYSRKSNSNNDYIWLKLAGDERFGVAVSADCDLLYSGVRNKNTINGKMLTYESERNSSDEINNVKTLIDDKYITIDNDDVFAQCGLNIVYGRFEKTKISKKKYNMIINEILEDSLNDAKYSKKPNGDAFQNIVENLSCTDVENNVQLINDIGFYLHQKKHYSEAESILRKTILCSPNRIPAYLNLADTLREQSKNDESKKYYQKYREMMIRNGKMIPERVLKL